MVVYTHCQHTFQFKQLAKVHVASDDPFKQNVRRIIQWNRIIHHRSLNSYWGSSLSFLDFAQSLLWACVVTEPLHKWTLIFSLFTTEVWPCYVLRNHQTEASQSVFAKLKSTDAKILGNKGKWLRGVYSAISTTDAGKNWWELSRWRRQCQTAEY